MGRLIVTNSERTTLKNIFGTAVDNLGMIVDVAMVGIRLSKRTNSQMVVSETLFKRRREEKRMWKMQQTPVKSGPSETIIDKNHVESVSARSRWLQRIASALPW